MCFLVGFFLFLISVCFFLRFSFPVLGVSLSSHISFPIFVEVFRTPQIGGVSGGLEDRVFDSTSSSWKNRSFCASAATAYQG